MKSLDKEILRLALPSILANITVPLVGMVDIAVAGHLHGSGALGAAEYIGGISVGALILNVIYWCFAFLRASTGGLTAQAFGRKDRADADSILGQSLALALASALLLLVLQWPLSRVGLLFADSTPDVAGLALRYFFIRIWAAPATLCLMSFKGWFIGMQDSVSSMAADLVVNAVNIAASIILTLGIGNWEGLGFDGIALGTVVAQYSGLAFAVCICIFKYKVRILPVGLLRRGKRAPITPQGGASEHSPLLTTPSQLTGRGANGFRRLLSLNGNLFTRSICFTGIYLGFTIIASRYGATLLACANIMMNLLMIFSYFTDGFAYAGEALTGRFIGAGDREMTKRTVRQVFAWSMGVAVLWMLIYLAAGMPLLRFMTDDSTVVEACREFLPWLIAMPLLGCAAFTWDGIYIGATAARGIRDAMIAALAAFLASWFVCKAAFSPEGPAAIHLLLGAYFMHLVARTVWLSARYGKDVLGAVPE